MQFRGVVDKGHDYDALVGKFELQSPFNIHFGLILLGKGASFLFSRATG